MLDLLSERSGAGPGGGGLDLGGPALLGRHIGRQVRESGQRPTQRAIGVLPRTDHRAVRTGEQPRRGRGGGLRHGRGRQGLEGIEQRRRFGVRGGPGRGTLQGLQIGHRTDRRHAAVLGLVPVQGERLGVTRQGLRFAPTGLQRRTEVHQKIGLDPRPGIVATVGDEGFLQDAHRRIRSAIGEFQGGAVLGETRAQPAAGACIESRRRFRSRRETGAAGIDPLVARISQGLRAQHLRLEDRDARSDRQACARRVGLHTLGLPGTAPLREQPARLCRTTAGSSGLTVVEGVEGGVGRDLAAQVEIARLLGVLSGLGQRTLRLREASLVGEVERALGLQVGAARMVLGPEPRVDADGVGELQFGRAEQPHRVVLEAGGAQAREVAEATACEIAAQHRLKIIQQRAARTARTGFGGLGFSARQDADRTLHHRRRSRRRIADEHTTRRRCGQQNDGRPCVDRGPAGAEQSELSGHTCGLPRLRPRSDADGCDRIAPTRERLGPRRATEQVHTTDAAGASTIDVVGEIAPVVAQ